MEERRSLIQVDVAVPASLHLRLLRLSLSSPALPQLYCLPGCCIGKWPAFACLASDVSSLHPPKAKVCPKYNIKKQNVPSFGAHCGLSESYSAVSKARAICPNVRFSRYTGRVDWPLSSSVATFESITLRGLWSSQWPKKRRRRTLLCFFFLCVQQMAFFGLLTFSLHGWVADGRGESEWREQRRGHLGGLHPPPTTLHLAEINFVLSWGERYRYTVAKERESTAGNDAVEAGLNTSAASLLV